MTTSPLKADSRAQFESWVMRINPNADLSVMVDGIDKGEYVDGYHAGLFAAWQASRASIVVELPPPSQWDICEVLLDKGKTVHSIRAAGITVKGE